MARTVTLKLLRTDLAKLNLLRDSSTLIVGEPYLVTDTTEQRIAIAHAINAYKTMVKREGDIMLGKLTLLPSAAAIGPGLNVGQGIAPGAGVAKDGDLWITPTGLYHQSNLVIQKMSADLGLPQNDDLIVNGDFWNNTPADAWTPGSDFICDQWYGYNSTTGTTVTMAKAAGQISRYGSPNCATITNTTANGIATLPAGSLLSIWQALEGPKLARLGWGYALAKPDVYVRFTIRTNVAGTYFFSLISADYAMSYVTPFVIAAAEVNTSKEFVLRIPAPTSPAGVWYVTTTGGTAPLPTSRGARLAWTFASGTTYQTNATNAWISAYAYAGNTILNPFLTTGFTVSITDVSFGQCVSSDAGLIAPPYRRKPHDVSINECMRYYQNVGLRWSGDTSPQGTYYATSQLTVPPAFTPVEKQFIYISGGQTWPIVEQGKVYTAAAWTSGGVAWTTAQKADPSLLISRDMYGLLTVVEWRKALPVGAIVTISGVNYTVAGAYPGLTWASYLGVNTRVM